MTSVGDKLDVVFDHTDRRMSNGEWAELDSELTKVDFESLDAVLGIGWLCSTFPGRDKLPSYRAALARLREVLTKRGMDSESILRGLDQ